MSKQNISKDDANLFFLTLWINHNGELLSSDDYRKERDQYFKDLEYEPEQEDDGESLILPNCMEYMSIIIHQYRTWHYDMENRKAHT